MAGMVISTTLWDEVEAAAVPLAKALRFELIRTIPRSPVVVGAVKIEQDPAPLGEPIAVPFERMSRPRGDGREEGVMPTNFLDKEILISASSRLKSLLDFRM